MVLWASKGVDFFDSNKFTEYVLKLLEEWHTPGVAIAIVQNRTIYSRGYGKACLDPYIPVTVDTLFDIASSSKSLTAAATAIILADEGLEWNKRMCELLPNDFVMEESGYTDSVTVEDILSHRTGLPGHDISYLGIRAEHPDTAESVTRDLRNLPTAAPVREKFMYCNMMYTVATHLIECLSGISFTHFLQQKFFNPLEMSSTFLQPDSAIAAGYKGRMARNYVWQSDQQRFKVVEWEQCPEAQGAGSIFTSVNDYIKLVRATMNQEPPITREIYKGLLTPRIIVNPDADTDELDPYSSPTMYAAGWEITFYRGHKIVIHDGQISGCGSCHFFLPQMKFGAVLLANSDEASDLAIVIARGLIDEVLGVPDAERIDWSVQRKESNARYEAERFDEVGKKLPTSDGPMQHPQDISLEKYTGRYYNKGYHEMNVVVKDGKLFVDATDRSMGFTLLFEHVRDHTAFIAHLSDYREEGDEPYAAEFRLEETKAVGMGIKLEDELDEFIWFDKIND